MSHLFTHKTRERTTIDYPVWMGVHEVTREQFIAIAGFNPSMVNPGHPDWPMDGVDRDGCDAFLAVLNEQEGGGYRLPTESEWEYCCRAGSTTAFSGYHRFDHFSEPDHDQALEDLGWYSENGGGRRPVGQKQPNAWGLYDMHGNVSEWVKDGWHDSYCSLWGTVLGRRFCLEGPPTDRSPWVGNDSQWVVRGGGFRDKAVDCRSAARRGLENDVFSSSGVGFRILREFTNPQ